jgi:adenosylcobinamide-phosphate synthase
MGENIPAVIIAAFILDAAAGDPSWLPHPVRGMGFLIEKGETLFRRIFCVKTDAKNFQTRERLAGTALAVLVCTIIFLFFGAIINIALYFGGLPCFLVSVIIAYLAISPRCLCDEAMKVYRKAKADDLEGARKALSMIVGRDTEHLSMEKVVKACVETVSESLADGVIAPLFYLAVGGPALAMLYKAANTMDSMIAYKNERYINFGRFAAHLDDVLGWIPARIAARLLIFAAFLLRFDAKNAKKIYKRDRYKHASPNSANCEAACAGALGIQLGGDAYYDGKLEQKPFIGDDLRRAETRDIVSAVRLMYCAAVLFVILASAVRAAVSYFVLGMLWK